MSSDPLFQRIVDDMFHDMTLKAPADSRVEDIVAQIADPVLQGAVRDAWAQDEAHREINSLTGSHLPASTPMPADDPAQILKRSPHTSLPTVFRQGCYICRDPEFAQMGMSLCYPCLACGGHVAADDTICDNCDADQQDLHMAQAVDEGHP